MSIRIHFAEPIRPVESEITYLLGILAVNKRISFEFVFSTEGSHPTVGLTDSSTIRVSTPFLERSFDRSQLDKSGCFRFPDQSIDDISTSFFYLTCMQEIADNDPDNLGRFKYRNSAQFQHNTILRNIVQECFDRLAQRLGIVADARPSSFFLSHDIDSVYGAIKEDGFNVIKKGRIDLFIQMLFNLAMSKPEWLNIDKIMAIESEYDCRSTFYWIVNKGKIDNIQVNADYAFSSKAIQKQFSLVSQNGFDTGLHKSLGEESFKSELGKLGIKPAGNRYHYLKFKLQEGFEAVEESGLGLDASLGFSEQWGFRNCYGLPYNPYNFKNRRPFSFVEAPLHIMDRTFFNRRMPLESIEKEIIDFFEANRTNCVMSVLWHNNFFTDYKYKGYLAVYKKILSYIKDNNFKTVSQTEIIQNYALPWQ
jgi:hypothetical protein